MDTVPRDGAIWFSWIESPVGPLLAVRSGPSLIGLHFSDALDAPVPDDAWMQDDSLFDDVRTQLREYFAGERRNFDLELAPRGTSFQREVWSALADIPYGCTSSYGELAEAIGRPGAMRAVGGANGANPMPIVIPCHRVIAADGTLGGFGGGLDRKVLLLELEGADFRR